MKKLLLIVEDNAEMANSLSEFLSEFVDEVLVATTVDQAQDYLNSRTFSLMTLDINLRGRNGSEVVKYLIDNPTNANKDVPVILISGMVSAQFIEKNKSRFAGVMGKPFQVNELREIAAKALSNQIEKKEEVELSYFDRIPFLKCKVPFTMGQLDSWNTEALGLVRLHLSPKAIFYSMKVDRNPDNYYKAHIDMMVHVLLSLAINLEWNTDKTQSKLVSAAYLHDIALADKPHLTKIHTLAQLEKLKATLDPYDYKLVFEHPNMAATTMAAYPDLDPDIITVLRQHHELPNETGFPAKLSFSKIIPMSALFIVAHDLTDYIIENPTWNINSYIPLAKMKFKGQVFTKVITALSSLK